MQQNLHSDTVDEDGDQKHLSIHTLGLLLSKFLYDRYPLQIVEPCGKPGGR